MRRNFLMKQSGLTKWSIVFLVLTGAASHYALAQSTQSADRYTAQLTGRLEGQDSVRILSFSPDGKILAAIGHDDNLWLWNVAAKKPRVIVDELLIDTTNLVFSPDGKRLAV